MAEQRIIDVSEHQGKIDWKRAKDYIDGAILRTGYGDDLPQQDDKYFKYNVEQCKKYSIPYGTYLYSYAGNNNQIKSEIAHEKRLTKNYNPVSHWYDQEEWKLRYISKQGAIAWLNEFGEDSGIYAGQAYWRDPLKGLECRRWIPAYGYNSGKQEKKYKPQFEMDGWQFTSRAHIPGIAGNVDESVWYVPFNIASKVQKEINNIAPEVMPEPINVAPKLEKEITTHKVYHVYKKEVAMLIMRHLCTHVEHGYTQDMDKRWGTGTETIDIYGKKYTIKSGDRDCSSAVISAFEAAGISCGGATYTGNMRKCMVGTGNFKWRPMSFIAQAGDVYLNEKCHTAMCLSAEPDVLMEFSINEKGTATGGKRGDQKQVGDYDEKYGRGESHLKMYYSYPWNGILECVNDEIAFDIEYEVDSSGNKKVVTGEKIVDKVQPVKDGGIVPVSFVLKKVTPDVVRQVYQGKYGKGAVDGSERFTKLTKAGYDAVAVQEKVNWVYKVAKGLLDGKASIVKQYGNGKDRRKNLGEWYDVVQKEINVLANIDKW